MIDWCIDNALQIVVIAYIIFMLLRGHKRGFLKVALSMTAIVITLFLSSILLPKVNLYVKENTKIQEGIRNFMLDDIGIDNISADSSKSADMQENLILNLNLPKGVKEALIKNNTDSIYESLGVERFKDYVSKYIGDIILNRIIFVLLFAIIWILLHIFLEIADAFTKIPVINGLNQIFGAILGLINSLVILWILCLFISSISGTFWGMKIMEQINDKWFLKFIYDNNLLSYFMKQTLYGIFS